MIPRYVDLIDVLPVSANARVQKASLRQIPVSDATLSFFAAGALVIVVVALLTLI